MSESQSIVLRVETRNRALATGTCPTSVPRVNFRKFALRCSGFFRKKPGFSIKLNLGFLMNHSMAAMLIYIHTYIFL